MNEVNKRKLLADCANAQRELERRHAHYLEAQEWRREAIREAKEFGGLTYAEIGAVMGLAGGHIGRIYHGQRG
ncbi:hypothetical protein [Corynebacterium caspium]|uniref:hypothetical protein n=1 Tax=Corynebacterium caspium TaxID=234828 RepID=UPI00037E4504|nr:hypothetical protein [Corynebacterium caspium]WKD59648.1 hypothetical protein CCASP_06325 [Corynebacterium caspium DSM 44850]